MFLKSSFYNMSYVLDMSLTYCCIGKKRTVNIVSFNKGMSITQLQWCWTKAFWSNPVMSLISLLTTLPWLILSWSSWCPFYFSIHSRIPPISGPLDLRFFLPRMILFFTPLITQSHHSVLNRSHDSSEHFSGNYILTANAPFLTKPLHFLNLFSL